MARAIKRTPIDHAHHLFPHFNLWLKGFIRPAILILVVLAAFAVFNVFQNTQNDVNNGTYNGKEPVEGNIPLVVSTNDKETKVAVKTPTPTIKPTITPEKTVESTPKPVSETPKKVNEAVKTVEISPAPAKTPAPTPNPTPKKTVEPTPTTKVSEKVTVTPKPTPKATIKPTPSPILTETPADGRVVIPYKEVKWEEVKLPGGEGFDQIMGFTVSNDGKIVDVYRCIGATNNGTATLCSHWQSTDYGKTWTKVEEIIVSEDLPWEIGYYQNERPKNNIETEEEILTIALNLEKDLWIYEKVNNNNNTFLLTAHPLFYDDAIYPNKNYTISRIFLSIKGVWNQLNFPTGLKEHDLWPETPQLTVLKFAASGESLTKIVISSDNSSIKLFLISNAKGATYWQATVPINN